MANVIWGNKPAERTNYNQELDAGELQKLMQDIGLGADISGSWLEQLGVANGVKDVDITLADLLAKAVDENDIPKGDQKVEELFNKAAQMESKVNALKTKMEALLKKQGEGKTSAKEDAQLSMYNTLVSELANAKSKLSSSAVQSSVTNSDLKEKIKKFAGEPTDANKDSGKQQTSGNTTGANSTTTPYKASSGTGANNGYGTDVGKADTGYGYNTDSVGSNSGFNPFKLSNSSIMDDFKMSAFDTINEQQKKQRMMLLFFYAARMAMSGDIGQMYNFLKIITHLICSDKALQNIWMGTKLIELQERSRQATQDLLNTDVGNDFQAEVEWSKKLQDIKSEEGVIATSQKLITQMMEEFTQIAEQLTNMQKSVLDVHGKVMSNLSTWR